MCTRSGQHLVADHDLGDAGRVAQVHEGDPAVVAATRHPAGQGDGRSGVLGTQRAGAVGAYHGVLPLDGAAARGFLRSDATILRAGPPVRPVDFAPLFSRPVAPRLIRVTPITARLLSGLVALCLGLLGAFVAAAPAQACDCAGISTSRALRQADAVFRGTVLDKARVGRGTDARTDLRFEVDAVYKGTVYREQVVASAREVPSCGLDPAVGSTWVVFAVQGIEGSGRSAVSRLVTTLCSGNLPGSRTPVQLGAGRSPLAGASDREERSVTADRYLSRGIAVAGIGALALGALAVLALAVLWRPGRGSR